MKKNFITKLMAASMVAALVVGGISAAPMTVHASWDTDINDGCAHSDREPGDQGEGHWEAPDNGSSGSGSNYDTDINDGCAHSDREPGDQGSGHWEAPDNGSSDAGSYDAGSGSSDAGSSDSGSAAASTGVVRKGSSVTVPGFETWRQYNKASKGQVTVYHKGAEAYMAQLKDANGNPVAFKGAGLYKDAETEKYYLNIITDDSVDTTGYTVSTWKGAASYLPKLGISGVMLNETLVVDAEAIAAAEAAAAAAAPAK